MPAESVIERLRRLEKEATNGPWFEYVGEACVEGVEYHKGGEPEPFPDRITYDGAFRGVDVALLCEVRNALPALLAVAEAAERVARNWDKCDAAQNPSLSDANHGNAIDDLCSAVRALREASHE